MHLRSGKVTVVPSPPWPRPSDVSPVYHETTTIMTQYFRHVMMTLGSSSNITYKRLAALEMAENLFANPHLLVEPHPYSLLICTIIKKFEDPKVVITTFNKEFYLARLKSLIGLKFIEQRKQSLTTLGPKIMEWACRPRGPLFRLSEKSFYANVF